jgi:general secretion pathway protein G
MTIVRCPYCKETHGPEPSPRCPHCGKDMVVPGHLRKTTLKDRQRMRDRIARDADRQRRALLDNNIRPGQNPTIVILMILVLVILGGLLIGRMNMSAKIARRPTREMRAEKELRALRIALERFRIDCGRYPTTEEGLEALVLDPGVTNWGGHYVNIVKPDPWRTPYVYTLTNNTVTLLSYGVDRHPNTPDDLRPDTPTDDEVRRKHP